jgi:hypothetical protein
VGKGNVDGERGEKGILKTTGKEIYSKLSSFSITP